MKTRTHELWRWSVGLVVLGILVGCATPAATPVPDGPSAPGEDGTALALTSSAFAEGETIPAVYTCDGENTSPPLDWEGMPEGTETLALIMDDPDAPGRTFVHWVMYNIPNDAGGLPEDIPGEETLSTGIRQGQNSRGQIGYLGPCPPSGSHRYFFKLYALDTALSALPDRAEAAALEEAMEGHILAETSLIGTYARQ